FAGFAYAPRKSAVADSGSDICRTRVNPSSVDAAPAHFNSDPISIRPGYVIDDGPRNEAPGDADCGVARRGADRPDRDVLVSQPGRPAPGGRGANPRRDWPRSGGQRPDRCFGFSRQLRLLSC